MKSKLTIVLLALAAVSAPAADAQGFLKKLKNKVDKVANTIDKTAQKVNNRTQNTATAVREDDEPYDWAAEEEKRNRSLHPELTYGKIIDTINFRRTPATIAVPRSGRAGAPFRFGDFHDGRAFVQDGNRFYFIDTEGNKYMDGLISVSSNSLDYYWPRFDAGRALVQLENAYAIVDKQGTVIKKFPKSDIKDAFGFDKGVGVIIYNDKASTQPNARRLQFIDIDGNNIFPVASYKSTSGDYNVKSVVGLESDSMRYYKRYDPALKMSRYGFIDAKGNIAVKPQFAAVHDFHCGLAAVQEFEDNSLIQHGRWGFVDKTGKMVIPFTFAIEPGDFHSGYALVKTRDQKRCLIDKTGAVVKREDGSFRLQEFNDQGYGYITEYRTGNHRFVYSSLVTIDNRIAYAVQEGDIVTGTDGRSYIEAGYPSRYGLLNPVTMTNRTFGHGGFFSEGLAVTEIGYVNEDGELVIIFTESEF